MKCLELVCKGIQHDGICHKCPHHNDPTFSMLPKEEQPCWRCKAGDSREQGHGRGIPYDEAPPIMVAQESVDPILFDDEDPGPSTLDIARVLLYALCQMKPQEMVTLVESFRTKDGSPQDLKDIKAITDRLFHEDLSFQMVDMRIHTAKKKLAEGARIASEALRL